MQRQAFLNISRHLCRTMHTQYRYGAVNQISDTNGHSSQKRSLSMLLRQLTAKYKHLVIPQSDVLSRWYVKFPKIM